jgi:CDP-glucose 4,6-dehydratase
LVKLIYKNAREKPNYQILDKAFMEIKDQYLSAQKAQKLLDWKPAYSLNKGLNKTINWYKDYFLAIS